MDRPKRERRPPQMYQPEIAGKHIKGYWSLSDKEKLFEALKKYGKDDINRLERALRPKKTKAQIVHYLKTLENRKPKNTNNGEAPIETWLRLANELTVNDADYSDILASVVSVCGNLEPHLPSKKASEVDYPAIYRYLDCLLRGSVNFPHMNELTAAILLDILQGMADTLKTMDLSVQRRLMAEKYKLLKGKVSISNPVHYEAARKALENDIELNGVMAMTERIPYPHQVPATQRYSRWNKRTAPSAVSSPAATQSTAASSSSPSPEAVAFQPPAKRVKLLPGVKIVPGTYKLSPKDLQVLLQSLSQRETQPGPGVPLSSPPAPTRVLTCLPSGAKTAEMGGIQGGAGVNVQSTGLVEEQTDVQSGAKYVSPGDEEPKSDLQSGAKQVSPGSDEPRSDLQSGAKQVSPGSEEPRSDLQSGAKQVSLGGDELQSTMQNGAKETQEQIGGETQVPNLANCGVMVQSDTAPSRTTDSVTVQNDSSQSVTKVTVQTDITASGSTNVTEPLPNTQNDIQILDKVVVPPNQGVGQSKTAAMLPKRTSLFSLNPLCVPVRYLKPNRVRNPCMFGGLTQDPNV